MFCKNCGTEIKENVPFCATCGARLDAEVTQQPQQPLQPAQQQYQQTYQQPYQNNPYQQQNYQQDNSAYDKKVGFVDAVKLMFTNYFNFSGRASLSEYWWAFVFNLLVSSVLGSIITVFPPLSVLSLALAIPGLALCIRRLHDTGKSWTYIFITLIPFVGSILLIIRLAKPSDGPNQWG